MPADADAPLSGADGERDWDAAWLAALDELELDLEDVEGLLRGSLPATLDVQGARWTEPVGLGPLPDSMIERAVALNARQLEVGRRLALALGATRREQELAARLSRFERGQRPIYVDHLM